MLDLSDVQGLVVRGYTMPTARHLVLRVDSAPRARALLASLLDGTSGRPQVTTAVPWTQKPDSCLNLSLTPAGLRALGVPEESLTTFPEEFLQGAAARAEVVGDIGPSDPSCWRPVFTDPGFHLLLSLFASTPQALERATRDLLAGSAPGLTEVDRLDAGLLPARVDHFGYVDGISQPTIDQAPPTGRARDPSSSTSTRASSRPEATMPRVSSAVHGAGSTARMSARASVGSSDTSRREPRSRAPTSVDEPQDHGEAAGERLGVPLGSHLGQQDVQHGQRRGRHLQHGGVADHGQVQHRTQPVPRPPFPGRRRPGGPTPPGPRRSAPRRPTSRRWRSGRSAGVRRPARPGPGSRAARRHR